MADTTPPNPRRPGTATAATVGIEAGMIITMSMSRVRTCMIIESQLDMDGSPTECSFIDVLSQLQRKLLEEGGILHVMVCKKALVR